MLRLRTLTLRSKTRSQVVQPRSAPRYLNRNEVVEEVGVVEACLDVAVILNMVTRLNRDGRRRMICEVKVNLEGMAVVVEAEEAEVVRHEVVDEVVVEDVAVDAVGNGWASRGGSSLRVTCSSSLCEII